MLTFSTPMRFAARAASIAVLPPPITATALPKASVSGAFLALYRKSITFITLPCMLSAPCFCAPVASRIYS